jgi:hypothetical protein
MPSKNPKRGAATRTAKKRTAAEWRQSYKEQEKRFADRAEQERLAWLSRPRLHTAIFEDCWRDEEQAREVAKYGGVMIKGATFKRHKRELKEATKDLGWSNERLVSFTQIVVSYRRNPSIENYLRDANHDLIERIRIATTDFPEAEALPALAIVLVERALNLRRHDRTTGSRSEVKNLINVLTSGIVDIATGHDPEDFTSQPTR